MPTIISDTELKSLDQILQQEDECAWALEAEIDYNAKLDFSDSSSDEGESEREQQNKKTTTTTAGTSSSSSGSPSKPTVIDATKKSSTSQADALGPSSKAAAAMLGGPSAHSGLSHRDQLERDRLNYVGRKSDSVYEFNKHEVSAFLNVAWLRMLQYEKL